MGPVYRMIVRQRGCLLDDAVSAQHLLIRNRDAVCVQPRSCRSRQQPACRTTCSSTDGDLSAWGAKHATIQGELFRSIHSFLTHAGSVSRLFWPATPRKRRGEAPSSYRRRKSQCADRAQRLRAALSVSEEEESLSRRTLRDHLEHFDERIDDWALSSERHNFIDRCVGPISSVAGADPGDLIRWFDPTDGSFHLRGTRFDLSSLATWIHGIRERTQQAAKEHGAAPPAV